MQQLFAKETALQAQADDPRLGVGSEITWFCSATVGRHGAVRVRC